MYILNQNEESFRHSTKALINGEITEYDACVTASYKSLDEAKEVYRNAFDYIGEGVIYSVNNILQGSHERCYFFKKKTKEENL